MSNAKKIGAIGWIDLTVDQPVLIKSFYQKVVGWTETSIPMGDYNDFCMNSPDDGSTHTGICKAAGNNVGLPQQWIIYITVASLTDSVKQVNDHGGRLLHGPRLISGQGSYVVIEDPAGAVCALFEHLQT